ncbi:MAG: hypothetical protein H6741_04225 [Alphaproteobacteria bacterium]|nr:hypothetical protein [Alphaproteobacteria bacterium]
MLVAGCYFGEIEVLPLDQPPVLKDSNHVNGETIVIERENQFIFIQVSDEVPEQLDYTWSLSHDGFVGDAESYPDGRSQVRLSNTDPGLDGQTLKCLVSDGSFDLTVSWPLEVVP